MTCTLREQMSRCLAFGGECQLFWEHSRGRPFWEAIIQKYFDGQTLLGALQNDHNNISDAAQQNQSAG